MSTVHSPSQMICFFVSDLHGDTEKYHKLFHKIYQELPAAVFIGGDLLPSSRLDTHDTFIPLFLVKELQRIKERLFDRFPQIFLILGNDDLKSQETAILDAEKRDLWRYCHNRCIPWREFFVYGYCFVPPTPFLLKDWERYDISRYVDPGCIPPEEGMFSIPVDREQIPFETIMNDLEQLTTRHTVDNSLFLFHSPPYQSLLDRASLDGKMVDSVPLDVHIGSIAIKRFIQERQPLLTLHGHVHESTRITGSWKDTFERTLSFNAAHDGPELSCITFNPHCLSDAVRILI